MALVTAVPVTAAIVTGTLSSVVETKSTLPTVISSGLDVVTVAPETKGPPVMVRVALTPACNAVGDKVTVGLDTATAAVPAVMRTTALLPSGLVRVTLVLAPAAAVVETSKVTAFAEELTTTTLNAGLLLVAVTPEELKSVPLMVSSVLVLDGATRYVPVVVGSASTVSVPDTVPESGLVIVTLALTDVVPVMGATTAVTVIWLDETRVGFSKEITYGVVVDIVPPDMKGPPLIVSTLVVFECSMLGTRLIVGLLTGAPPLSTKVTALPSVLVRVILEEVPLTALASVVTSSATLEAEELTT